MPTDEGTLLALSGGVRVKARVQHPKVHKDGTNDRNWFFRYWADEIQPDGSLKAIRKKHICGPSKGNDAISQKQAEMVRDEELRKINAPNLKAAMAKGQALFREMAKMYIDSHLERRGKVALPTKT